MISNLSSRGASGRSAYVPRRFSRMLPWQSGGFAVRPGQTLHGQPALRAGHRDMARELSSNKTNKRGRKARKFYIVSYSMLHKRADFEVENLQALLMGAPSLRPPQGRRGFPVYPEKPRIVIGKRQSGPLPSDIELYHFYWLISDLLKFIFEAVDPSAFVFQECDVFLRDGSPGPSYWLCDVVRIIEAFSDETSNALRGYRKRAGFNVSFSARNNDDLVFNESAVNGHHVFITPYSAAHVFCDQVLKDACREAGIKGISFEKLFRR